MEVCGGHTNTIVKYGIKELIPSYVKLISGPGCPVCVTSQKDIDSVIKLALNGVKIATYGDMVRVPGSNMSLRDAMAKGADIQIVYSTDQIEKDRVFFAIGFETTQPMTASCLKRGIKVFSSHKLIPPAMKLLPEIDGFIDPGHVATVIGSRQFMELKKPQVICGFKPEMMIKAISDLVLMIKNNDNSVKNNYKEVVLEEGNLVAKKAISETMKVVDSEWRGFGVIPNSGLVPIDPQLDAKLVYSDLLKDVKSIENDACCCSDVIKGKIEPTECPLFGKSCTLENPKGACMVSRMEGACAIYLRYGK